MTTREHRAALETLRRSLLENIRDWEQTGGGALSRVPLVRASAAKADVESPPVAREEKFVNTKRSPPNPQVSKDLHVLHQDAQSCVQCSLHEGRKNVVFGSGSASASILFVAAAPRAEDDRTGIPFSGAPGALLDRMLAAMKLSREQVFLTQLTLCRPINDRDVTPQEFSSCEHFFKSQVAAVQPKIIVCFGKAAVHRLLETDTAFPKVAGRWAEFAGVPFMPTYHPAFLLQAPERKREVWRHLQMVMRRLDATDARV